MTTPSAIPPHYGPPISLELAKQVATAAEVFAERRRWPVVIAIVDSTGHLALLHRLDQAHLASVAIAQRKAETAVNFRRPTKEFEEIVNGGGTRVLSIASQVVALEGGLPLLKDGVVIGAIGVSGMSSPEDGEIAAAGAAVLG
jgi:uncharacterized protein GlcG (DUF336 family)